MLNEFKPTTPSQRRLIRIKDLNLAKSPLLKFKKIRLKKSTGRNNSGKITIYHKGGGVKRMYRNVNFYRIEESTGIVLTLEYDPYRNANIAAVFDNTSRQFFYILAPKGLKIGDIVQSGNSAGINLGNSLPIERIPVGSYIYNIATQYLKKATITRSAGTFSQLLEKTKTYARVKLPSKEQRYIPLTCFATIGTVSNDLHLLTNIGKAGRNRWLNNRPTVRGVAMNPVDHPHGGGEGKTSGGRTATTPWGTPTKHKKTSTSTNLLRIKTIK